MGQRPTPRGALPRLATEERPGHPCSPSWGRRRLAGSVLHSKTGLRHQEQAPFGLTYRFLQELLQAVNVGTVSPLAFHHYTVSETQRPGQTRHMEDITLTRLTPPSESYHQYI